MKLNYRVFIKQLFFLFISINILIIISKKLKFRKLYRISIEKKTKVYYFSDTKIIKKFRKQLKIGKKKIKIEQIIYESEPIKFHEIISIYTLVQVWF